MNNITRVLFLMFVSIHVFSQVSFVKSITTSDEEIPICIKQMGNAYFASIRTCHEQVGLWQGTRLIKLDSAGNTLAELSFEIAENNIFSIETILPISESEFIAVADYKNQADENAYIYVMKMDTSLIVLWENRFAVNTPLVGNVSSVINKDSSISIGASCQTYWPGWQRQLLFLEINTSGDSLQAKYETHGNPNSTSIYSLINMNGQYKAFVDGYASLAPFGFSQILQLDTSFNLIAVKPVPYFIEAYMTGGKINELQYYITGMAYSSATYYDVGIAKLSDTEDSLAYNHAGKPGVVVDYSGWKKCMAIANANSIYTGGTGNDNGLFYNCNQTKKVLMLSNYDSLLNCRWTRFYGSDTACYTMSTLEATSDGGCIMGGMFYTPARPENMLDAVIIKVDSLGLFTGIPENAPIQLHEAIVYPNPGQDNFSVQSGPQVAGAKFKMYDAAGCTIMETTLVNTIEQMDASTLLPGIYPWQIIHKGKIKDRGKWIKQH